MPKIELRSYSKARTPLGTLLRLFRYFRHCRLILISAVVSILLYCAATIAASYAMRPLVNLLEGSTLSVSATYAKYLALLLGLAFLYLLSAVTNYLLNRLMLESSAVIMLHLRTELFAKMQKLPVRYFDENTNGSLMSYFTNDIEATNELLQHSITHFKLDGLVGNAVRICGDMQPENTVLNIPDILRKSSSSRQKEGYNKSDEHRKSKRVTAFFTCFHGHSPLCYVNIFL